MRVWNEVMITGEPRAKWFGHVLHGLFGTSTPCTKYTLASISGTFVEGETVTESTTSATGVIKRLDQGAGTPAMYLSVVSGTFGTAHTLTGGTSAATATGTLVETSANARWHIFRVNNTNNHPAYTIYNNDPLADERATYCMLDSLLFEVVSNDWAKFTAKYLGKLFASTSAQTPTYTAEDAFFGKNVTVKTASAFTGLDAASALNVESIKLTFSKNVEAFQAFGGTGLTSIHNRAFSVKGEMTLLYNAVTQRDYLTNSTEQALRVTLANTGGTLLGSASYPTIQFDFPLVYFTDFKKSEAIDGLVKQTVAFVAEYDITRSMCAEGILLNSQVSAY